MRSISRVLLFGVLSAFVFLSGCQQKVNEQRTLKLEGGDIQAVRIGAPDREQEVTVSVNASGSAVDVYVAPDKEAVNDKGEALIPKNVIAHEKKVLGEKTLKAKIPAKTPYAVIVNNPVGKEATVTLKIEGK